MARRPPEHPEASAQLRACIEAGERERARIARDLHDQLGQRLGVLALKLDALRDSPGVDGATRQALADLRALARAADDDLDQLVWRLRPAALDDLGLAEALRDLVDGWSREVRVPATLEVDGLEGARLDAEVETAFYRVAQEALNNIAKYAHARTVRVRLAREGREATLEVGDDGAGFDSARVARGRFGLVGMNERAMLLGGRLEVRSRPGDGTTIILRVPAERAPGE